MSPVPDPAPAEFLGLPLRGPTTAALLERVTAAARNREALRVGYLNAAQVNLAFERAAFAADLAALDLLYADGQAVVWAARWRGLRIPERVNAGDFTRELMQRAAASGLKLALVGGAPAGGGGDVCEAERAAALFMEWAPGLRIVFTHHGYFSDAEAPAVLAGLQAADPDLVLLGMGAPRQERWCRIWSAADGEAPATTTEAYDTGAVAMAIAGERAGTAAAAGRVWWCVGALFEYYAGTRARAPRWMRRAGLEWLVRLVLEPRRLWRRYLLGNPLFIWRTLRGREVRRRP